MFHSRIEKLMDDIKAERMKVVELTAENRKLTDQVGLYIVSLHGVTKNLDAV